MKQQTLGNKPQNQWMHVQSIETALTIKRGAPVVLTSLAANSAKFGYGVKSIESLAAAEEGFFLGMATEDIAPAAQSTTVFGYVANTRVLVNSRSASSAVWPSTTGILIGDILDFITVVGVQAVSRVGAGSALSAANNTPIQAFESYASTTTQASSITIGVADTGLLYSTAFKKTFISLI